MNITRAYVDRDLAGRPAPTRVMQFGSQQEQVLFLGQMVRAYRNRLPIRERAVAICREYDIPAKRKIAQAIGIGRWVQREIYYVNEGDETFQSPIRTLKSGFGDCDDFTTLIGALCESIGIPCQLVGMSVNSPGLTHIFPRAVVATPLGPRYLPLDATLSQPAGSADPIRIAVARGDRVRIFTA